MGAASIARYGHSLFASVAQAIREGRQRLESAAREISFSRSRSRSLREGALRPSAAELSGGRGVGGGVGGRGGGGGGWVGPTDAPVILMEGWLRGRCPCLGRENATLRRRYFVLEPHRLRWWDRVWTTTTMSTSPALLMEGGEHGQGGNGSGADEHLGVEVAQLGGEMRLNGELELVAVGDNQLSVQTLTARKEGGKGDGDGPLHPPSPSPSRTVAFVWDRTQRLEGTK